jgi:hypothetical protein
MEKILVVKSYRYCDMTVESRNSEVKINVHC